MPPRSTPDPAAAPDPAAGDATHSPALDAFAGIERSTTRHETVHGDRRVVWRCVGRGPALVLVHGGHGSWLHWVRNIEALSRRHTLWLPDLPGYGDSDHLDTPARPPERLERLVEAVERSMSALPIGHAPVDMAAFSFGAIVAARLAARGRVRRLALLGPAGHGGNRRPRAELVDWRLPDPDRRREALRHNLAALMLHDPARIDDAVVNLYEAQVRACRFSSKPISRSVGLAPALDAFAGPLLLAWGEHDVTAVPAELAPRWVAGRRGATTWHLVGDAGHWVQYEQADTVSAMLVEWFGAPGPSDSH